MSKRLGGTTGCKDKTSSWHLNGFPYGSNIGSTVSMFRLVLACSDYGHVRPDLPRHPEVGNLATVSRVQQDVGTLNIAVDETLPVEELERAGRVRQDRYSELPADLPSEGNEREREGFQGAGSRRQMDRKRVDQQHKQTILGIV